MEKFAVQLPNKQILCRDTAGLYLVPQGGALFFPILQKIPSRLAQVIDGKTVITEEFAFLFGAKARRNTITLDYEQCHLFLSGKDLDLKLLSPNHQYPEQIVIFDQLPLGIVKIVGQKLKNKLSRHLVQT